MVFQIRTKAKQSPLTWALDYLRAAFVLAAALAGVMGALESLQDEQKQVRTSLRTLQTADAFLPFGPQAISCVALTIEGC